MALPATAAVYYQIDMAIGVTIEAVCNMQEREEFSLELGSLQIS
jgi:hypothetical protein